MIVGNGLIAGLFEGRFALDRGTLVFASGVSNSSETDAGQFAREETLLKRSLAERPAHTVYFSTCSVVDHDLRHTPYVEHKLRMERLVEASGRHCIFRLPQVVGRTPNPFTLTNYLGAKVASGARFAVWKNAWRNIIDADDVAAIAIRMIEDAAFRDRTLNIANPRQVRVLDLVRIFESVMGKVANFELVDRGDHYEIDVAEAARIARTVPVEFGPDYVERVIRKYYGKSGARA